MKLAFTTLGCPSWDLSAIVSRAQEYGFDGIDFRGYLGDMEIYERPEFSTDKEATAQQIADAGLDMPCFSSGAGLMPTRKSVDESIREVRAYAELCPTFSASYIRIFGQSIGERNWEEGIEVAAGTLKTMAQIAADNGAKVLLETHDAWVHSAHIRALMETVDSPHVGVIWDIHHPLRAGETPQQTWDALHPWIANTHWKDASLPDHELCLMGEGDLPLQECVDVLKSGGFDGYYTLEWEKKWHPDLADPDVAFPGYIEVMRKLERKPS